MQRREFVIIGGGVAGLSAANRLVDLGAQPLLIEAGRYPSHKVCGEHFSHEALPILRGWGVEPLREISTLELHAGRGSFCYPFPYAAASGSRFCFDSQLCDRARRLGAEIRTGTHVVDLTPGSPCRLTLSTGESLEADHLLIGTGRVTASAQQKGPAPYIGLKCHFAELEDRDRLELFLFEGGYCGLSPIEDGHHNVAILASRSYLRATPRESFEAILSARSGGQIRARLSKGRPLFDEWKMAMVPHFGVRSQPKWEGCYFLGDAMGAIAPAAGDGLAMGVTSGWLAAEYAMAKDFKGFRWAWHRCYRERLRWANFLHQLMVRPRLAKAAFCVGSFYPPLTDLFFHKTRG